MSECVVFLPGILCDARAFWHQIVAFSGQGPVQVAVALEGEGIAAMAEAHLAQLPARFALVGAGLGGNLALEILDRAPERVTRIALLGVSVLAETPQDAAQRELRLVAAQAGRLGDAVARELPSDALAPGVVRTEIVALLHDMARTLGEKTYVAQSRALQRRSDQQKILRRAMVPALVLCGEHDPITLPRRHEVMAQMLPYGRLEVIAEAGHLPALEQPARTTAALRRWLAEPQPRRMPGLAPRG